MTGQLSGSGRLDGAIRSGSGGYYEHDYEKLKNLPVINGTTVIGSFDGNHYGLINSADNLGMQEIDNYFATVFGN